MMLSKLFTKGALNGVFQPVAQPLDWYDELVGSTDSDILDESVNFLTQSTSNNPLSAEELLEATLLLDEKNRPRVEALTEHYLSAGRANQALQNSLFFAVYQYQRALFLRYTKLTRLCRLGFSKDLDDQKACLLICRQLNAAFTMIKWRTFEDQVAPIKTWNAVFDSLKIAEKFNWAYDQVTLYPNDTHTVNIAKLLKHGCLMSTLQKANFTQQQVELAQHILLSISTTPKIEKRYDKTKFTFYLDLNTDKGFDRVRSLDAIADYRFMQTGQVVDYLVAFLSTAKKHNSLSAFSIAALADKDKLTDVVAKLLQEWSPVGYQRQRRKEDRKKISRTLDVLFGFEAICKFIAQGSSSTVPGDLKVDLAFDRSLRGAYDLRAPLKYQTIESASNKAKMTEKWLIVDESATGFAVQIDTLQPDITVGNLVAYRTQAGQQLGLAEIKSVKKQASGKYRVGLAVLGLQQKTVQVSKVVYSEESIEGIVVDFGENYYEKTSSFSGLLLSSTVIGESETLILPRHEYASDSHYVFELAGQQQVFAFTNATIQKNDWVSVALKH